MNSAITSTSTVKDVVEYLEAKGLGEIKNKLEECEVDGETFIGMDLLDIHGLTPKLKLRKVLRMAWTEVTGMEFNPNGEKFPVKSTVSLSPRTPSAGAPSSSSQTPPTSDVEETTFVRRTSPRKQKKRKPDESTPLSTAGPSSDKRARLFKNDSPAPSKEGNNPNWLAKFELPQKWEPSVQAALEKGELTAEHKNALNRQLCMTIRAFTNTVSKSQREHIAVLLVQQYPCLKGSVGAGHSFWAKKIKDRFENLNKKKNREMRKLFIREGQEVPKGKPGRKKAIHPSSVIPAIPEGVTDDTYEEQRRQIVTEWRKSKKNYSLIKEVMSSTFPIRRREVLTQNVRVWKIMEDFPNFASSSGNEIRAELGRILQEPDVTKSIRDRFQGGWRESLLTVVRCSDNKEVMAIIEEVEGVDISDEKEVENRCIMASLPYLLADKRRGAQISAASFWKRAKVEDEDERIEKLTEESTSPRLISTGDLNNLQELYLASEAMVVCRFNPPSILNAVATLLGSFYSFNQFGSMPVLEEAKTMVYVTNHNMITMAMVIFKTYKMADKGGEERVLTKILVYSCFIEPFICLFVTMNWEVP